MPFTFSHPAIVLPFSYLPKRWVSMAGLITGSMVPDFEYFMRMRVKSIYSHTWPGLLWFDLPLGLLIMFVYQKLVKDELIDHLPTVLNQRFTKFKGTYKKAYSFQYWVVVAASILVGAVSHIVWDGFTHPNGYFVLGMPILSNIIRLGGHQLYVYKVIQHASTLIGAIVIVTVVYTLPLSAHKTKRHIVGFWIQVVSAVVIVLVIRLNTGLTFHQYGDIIVTMIAGGLLGLIMASIMAHIKMKAA